MDIIDNLPLDQSVVTNNEAEIVKVIIGEHKGKVNKILKETKDVLIAGVLFVALSQFQAVDDLIIKFIPTANNSMIMGIVKFLIFICILFIIYNFALSRGGNNNN